VIRNRDVLGKSNNAKRSLLKLTEAQEHFPRWIEKSIMIDQINIPALLNQLLAIVTSAAKPSTRSWENSFIVLYESPLKFDLEYSVVDMLIHVSTTACVCTYVERVKV